VANRKVYEIESARNWSAVQELGKSEIIRSLPAVPVLSETLLLMELVIRKRCVDLAQVSGLILTDLGATLQVLRLAGRECNFPPNLPYRIEDCISDLGPEACLEAMAQHTITRCTRHSPLLAMWEHAREISGLCATIARQTSENLNPEDASLVGLCHELGELPAALGWHCILPVEKHRAGFKIAHAWGLPPCVLQFFSRSTAKSSNQWSGLVDRAHQPADSSIYEYPSVDHLVLESDSFAALQVASS